MQLHLSMYVLYINIKKCIVPYILRFICCRQQKLVIILKCNCFQYVIKETFYLFQLFSACYYDIGHPIIYYHYRGANMWYRERKHKFRHAANIKFSMCCEEGKVQIPLLKTPTQVLQEMLFHQNSNE